MIIIVFSYAQICAGNNPLASILQGESGYAPKGAHYLSPRSHSSLPSAPKGATIDIRRICGGLSPLPPPRGKGQGSNFLAMLEAAALPLTAPVQPPQGGFPNFICFLAAIREKK